MIFFLNLNNSDNWLQSGDKPIPQPMMIIYKNYELTKDTPYLTLTGELCSTFCEYFG